MDAVGVEKRADNFKQMLRDLEERAERASQGSFYVKKEEGKASELWILQADGERRRLAIFSGGENASYDAEYMAFARPRLIKELIERFELLRAWNNSLDAWVRDVIVERIRKSGFRRALQQCLGLLPGRNWREDNEAILQAIRKLRSASEHTAGEGQSKGQFMLGAAHGAKACADEQTGGVRAKADALANWTEFGQLGDIGKAWERAHD